MKLACLLRAMFAVLVLQSGCGRTELPYTDNSRDPKAYAQDIKTLVSTAARGAKGSKEPIDFLAPVLQELKRTDRPVGEFRPVYDELRNRVERLILDCERAGGRAPNLSARLDELIKLAQILPGAGPPANPK